MTELARAELREGDENVVSVGEYRVISHIAAGGMGTVYLCRRGGQGGFARLFALKVMHPHLAEDDDFVQMLLDEARIAARLHHPNIVGIVDVGHHDQGFFVVMDYIEGCSLAQLLKRSPERRPAGLVASIALDMLHGLHAAHTLTDDDGHPLNLVHRDVSPQNVLIGIDGTARITDFGIAKAETRITHTVAGVRKGKVEYMSPEQITTPEDLDVRSDIFAAGTVLWTALTGQRLFRGETPEGTVENVLQRPIPPPSKIVLGIPASFDAVVLKALQRDKEKRFPSAEAMADALRAAALRAGLLAPSSAVGSWVSTTFGQALKERRDQIAAAVAREKVVRATVDQGKLTLPHVSDTLPTVAPLTPSGSIPALSESVIERIETTADKPADRTRRLHALMIGAMAVAVLVGAAAAVTIRTHQNTDDVPRPEPTAPAVAVDAPPPASTEIPAPAPPTPPAPSPATPATSATPPTPAAPATSTTSAASPAAQTSPPAPPVETDIVRPRHAQRFVRRGRPGPPATESRPGWRSAPTAGPAASEPAAPVSPDPPPPAPSTGVEGNPYLRRH